MSSAQFSGRFDQALKLAALVHAGVPRKGTVIPYLIHPVHVARLLDRHGFSEEVILAGLLHDVLEDAEFDEPELQISMSETFAEFAAVAPSRGAFRVATESFIAKHFGEHVLQLVHDVTERKAEGAHKRPWRERKDEQLTHLRGVNRDAAALKAADALHNVQSVLSDVERAGLEALQRFNCKTEETLWYYGAVADGLRDALNGHALHAELDEAVFELTEKIDRLLVGEGAESRCGFCGNVHEAVSACGSPVPTRNSGWKVPQAGGSDHCPTGFASRHPRGETDSGSMDVARERRREPGQGFPRPLTSSTSFDSQTSGGTFNPPTQSPNW